MMVWLRSNLPWRRAPACLDNLEPWPPLIYGDWYTSIIGTKVVLSEKTGCWEERGYETAK